MSSTLSTVEAPEVRWVTLIEPHGSDGPREQACRRVWDRACSRGRQWNARTLDTVAVRTTGGTLVIAGDGAGRLAAALVDPSAVISVIRYELREALHA